MAYIGIHRDIEGVYLLFKNYSNAQILPFKKAFQAVVVELKRFRLGVSIVDEGHLAHSKP